MTTMVSRAGREINEFGDKQVSELADMTSLRSENAELREKLAAARSAWVSANTLLGEARERLESVERTLGALLGDNRPEATDGEVKDIISEGFLAGAEGLDAAFAEASKLRINPTQRHHLAVSYKAIQILNEGRTPTSEWADDPAKLRSWELTGEYQPMLVSAENDVHQLLAEREAAEKAASNG